MCFVRVAYMSEERGVGGTKERREKVMLGVALVIDLEVSVILVWQRSVGSSLELLVVDVHKSLVNLNLRGCKGRRSGKLERRVADQLTCQPQEGLLKVVVGLGRDLKVLQVLLAVERDGSSLDFPLLYVDLVAAQNNGNVLADALQVTVPCWYVLVSDATGDVEHDDTALSLNVVAVTQTTELLLSRRVPNVEDDGAVGGVELERVDLDTECSNVLLLEFSRKVALYESRLSGSSVTNEDQLEGWLLYSFGHFDVCTACV